jgi:multiple sugar transport system substrate-binding protein
MLGAKGFGAFLWFPFAWQNGATLISDDGKTAQFGNDAGKEAWQFYSDLYLTQKIVPDALKSATTSWDQLFAPFIQEKVAMMMTGDWGISAVKGGNANLDFGIAPLPKGKQAATVIGGYDLAIPKTSKQADAAWAFLKWFTAKEQESVLQSYNRIQARQDIIGSEYANKDPLIKVFIDQSGAGRARATVPQWDEIENTILADAWDSVTLGQAKAAEALATAVKKANDLLKG